MVVLPKKKRGTKKNSGKKVNLQTAKNAGVEAKNKRNPRYSPNKRKSSFNEFLGSLGNIQKRAKGGKGNQEGGGT